MDFSSLDLFYYTEYKDKFQPSYDYENLILTAGCNSNELSYDKVKAELTTNELKYHGNFIHEFIHHLQNFSTTWGGSTFADFILAYLKISASGIGNNEKIKLPILEYQGSNQLMKDGFFERRKVLEKLKKESIIRTDEKKEFRTIKIEMVTEKELVTLDCETTHCAIGVMVIREHMACLGTLLFWELNDDEIHKHFRSFTGFLSERGELAYQPQYWIVFEYFHQGYAYKNIGEGLFNLMNECLTRLNPHKAFYRFIRYWSMQPDRLLLGKNFNDFVVSWVDEKIEQKSFSVSFEKVTEHIEKRLELVSRIGVTHDLGDAGLKILEMIYQNINETQGGRNLFTNLTLFSQLQFWKDKITYFGTPIICFNDEVKIKGTKEYCDHFMEKFVQVNSVSMVLKKIREEPEFQCPFFYDIPICSASFKGDSSCERKPFSQVKMEEERSCNFRNGVILLNLKDKLE